MAEYTKVHLNEVENLAPKFGMEGIEARFATGALELEKSGLSYQTLDPGVRVPFGHKHGRQEEVYVVVSGGGRLKIEDEILELSEFDAVRVPGGEMRGFEAGPKGLSFVAFGAPSGVGTESDADMEPGWWGD